MNMPSGEYNRVYRLIRDWFGSKEALQALYDEIFRKYDDGREMIRRLDSYQSKWTMNLH